MKHIIDAFFKKSSLFFSIYWGSVELITWSFASQTSL